MSIPILGYTVDLCKRIITRAVKEEGLFCSVRYKELTSADRFEFLKNNEIDMLCGATTVTLERLRVADFSLFTFLSGASLMYAQYASNQENGQKNSLNVGVLQKTTTREQVRDIISNLQQQEDYFKPIILQNVEITPYSNHYAGLYGLLEGEIDAYIADREILLALKTKGEQILEARNTVKQSIWYVIFNDNVDSDNLDELDFGVLDTIADDQATQIINDLTQHDGGDHQTGADEVSKYSNYGDGLKALDNKEIQAFIADSGIFTALQKREENSLEAQAENKPMKYTVDMKIVIVTDKQEDPDENKGYGETNETDVKLIVLQDYFTVEPYAIGIRLGATDLRYVADKVLNEMFAWNKESGASEIYTILQRSFPGKKFSKSIENMFRLQRVSVGTRVADEFLPRIPRAKCKALESSSDAVDKAQPATSP
jgi:ABC-type amino acid transport substrate-binding protein